MSEKDESVIPKGRYCYSGSRAPGDEKFKPCPYWSLLEEYKGHCSFLEYTDGDSGFDLLWDQVKACNVNKFFLSKKQVKEALDSMEKDL